MSMEEFKARMLAAAIAAGEALCEYALDEGIEKEPEQVRKNVATILRILTETEDFLNSIGNRTNV